MTGDAPKIPRSCASGVLMLTLFLTPSARAAPWVPDECEDRMSEIAGVLGQDAESVVARWDEQRRQVLKARPGDAYYAPRPYPRSREEVLQDFEYAYFERLRDDGVEHLEARERQVYERLEDGTLEIKVHRVENWDTSRCRPSGPVRFFHLIRLFSAAGEELARATILPTGLLGQYAQVSPVASRAFVTTEEVAEHARAMTGRSMYPTDAQYAAVDGLPLGCDALLPCVVFRSGGSIWILDRGALLYEITSSSRRTSVSELRRQADEERMLKPLGATTAGRALVTQGFGWAEATLVAIDEELAELQGIEEGAEKAGETGE